MIEPFYTDDSVTLYHGDCLDVLRELPDASVDSVCTDPPYGLEFMGRQWDKFAPTTGSAAFTPDAASTAPIKSTFKDGVGTRIGAPKKNPRCLKCGKLGFDHPGRKCSCETPDFDTRTREYAQTFQAWCEQWATECRRVLKPGGHMLAFGGSRTWHRLTCAIEDAGFEIRDSIAWLYGSGFPKSLDVSKAIDKAAGAEREPDDYTGANGLNKVYGAGMGGGQTLRKGDAATLDAQRWQGWGTALKPAFEPIVVARKPLVGTVAGNVLAYGTGALNVAACRVTTSPGSAGSSRGDNTACTCPSHGDDQTTRIQNTQRRGTSDAAHGDRSDPPANARPSGNGHRPLLDSLDGYQSLPRSSDEPAHAAGGDDQASAPPPPDADTSPARCATCGGIRGYSSKPYPHSTAPNVENAGRWPANVVLDESQAAALDAQSGVSKDGVAGGSARGFRTEYVGGNDKDTSLPTVGYGGEGGASRFFPTFRYEPKAPTTERPRDGGTAHPTVKPLDLMRWLVRLVTPPGGTVLEPFAGSGTTAEACVVEGFRCVAIEREADYLPLIVQRLSKPIQVALDFDSL